jgi:hypothetical protein
VDIRPVRPEFSCCFVLVCAVECWRDGGTGCVSDISECTDSSLINPRYPRFR